MKDGNWLRGGGGGEALVSYLLETTIGVEVGWGGQGGLLDMVERRYRGVCGVCPQGLGGKEKTNQLDLWAQKRERIQNIVEVR